MKPKRIKYPDGTSYNWNHKDGYVRKDGIMDTLSKGIICDRSCETDHSTIEALKSTVKELQSLDKHLVEKQIANIENVIDFIFPMVNLIVIICPSCCNIQYLHSGNGRGVTKGYCGDCLKKYPAMRGE